MCRFAIYKGPSIALSKIVVDPPHSLVRQSFDAREMLSGSSNSDGFGIGWYQSALSEKPALYRNPSPITTDLNVPMLRGISGEIILAHVRGASDGMPVSWTNTHPFSYQQFLYMHNGSVDEFRTQIYPEFISLISPFVWNIIKGNTDSEHVFGLWLSRLNENRLKAGDNFSLTEKIESLRQTIRELEKLADKKRTDIVLNIGLTDGRDVIATRHHFGNRKATLYYLENSDSFPNGYVIASEKLFDDPHWKAVPEKSILTIDQQNRLRIEPVHA
ncbi:ergothioneine biosynthesis protein EgtC [bacterium]|nr:ergothioneine biosynthesis protein EgtC [bacterium]